MAKSEVVKPSAPPAPPEAPKAAAPKAAEPARRKMAPLIVARWSEAQFKQARHAISPEANTPYADVLDPAFYAHIAPKVNAGDVIEIRPADGAYYAEVYVWAKGSNWLRVSELTKIERPANSVQPAAVKGFSIDFVDGPAKHRVIRNSDAAIMAQNFDSPEAANEWLGQNGKRIAA